MWLLIKLVWRILTRLRRNLGWSALLVPVAATGMLLFGLTAWTVAAVLVALILALRLPAMAAGLVPVTMVGMGVGGLAAAASTPGGPVAWVFTKLTPGPGLRRLKAAFRVPPAPPAPGRPPVPPKFAVAGTQIRAFTKSAAGKGQGFNQVTQVRLKPVPPVAGSGFMKKAFLDKNILAMGRGSPAVWRHVSGHGPSLWQSRLAVPLALILLTLGLWLAPRTLAYLRAHHAIGGTDLRAWLVQNRWAVLLIPVSLLGLSVFGVHPWTVAAVIVAVVLALRWPAAAADLAPGLLVAYAVFGFAIAASWRSATGPGPGPWPGPVVHYAAVYVDSWPTALLAGAEASAFLAFAAWLVPRTIAAHARKLAATGPDPDLVGRVQRLTESRGHAVDAATSELRRIERDLHDGAQARLVALGMNLRAVQRMLPASPQAALALVAEAQETSLRALNELRDLVRGIYPPVLADRGLGHAVRALALDAPLPTELDIDLPGRLSAPVESACYFAVAEALANAVKHSGARRVHIRLQHKQHILRIEVADNGVGGADPASGTGLRGVERRLGTFDGILAISSPPGGPTMIAMEVPCALLSPRTSSS
jgi:signal transduction histidine kinase